MNLYLENNSSINYFYEPLFILNITNNLLKYNLFFGLLEHLNILYFFNNYIINEFGLFSTYVNKQNYLDILFMKNNNIFIKNYFEIIIYLIFSQSEIIYLRNKYFFKFNNFS